MPGSFQAPRGSGRWAMVRAAAAALALAALAAASFYPVPVWGQPRAEFDVRPLALQGEAGIVTLDYFAWEPVHKRLWVPGGNTGNVFVVEPRGWVAAIADFPTAEFTLGSRRGRLGASSVAIGDAVAYVGNRADRTICVLDAVTLEKGDCLAIATPEEGWAGAPDAVVYVAPTKEVWVTRGAPPIGIASSD